jgi:hypothetical protein
MKEFASSEGYAGVIFGARSTSPMAGRAAETWAVTRLKLRRSPRRRFYKQIDHLRMQIPTTAVST